MLALLAVSFLFHPAVVFGQENQQQQQQQQQKASAVEVKKTRSAQTKYFDPDDPPADMPPLQPPEAAVTVSAFSCAAQMSVRIVDEQRRDGRCYAKARIESVRITIGLDVTVWLPDDATRKIKVHEDAHRKISDHYFQRGEPVARKLAEPYVGKTIEGSANNCTAAVDEAIKAAIREFGGAYMAEIENKAGEAQKIFDQITDHGRNDVKEDDAIKRAIEQVDAGKK